MIVFDQLSISGDGKELYIRLHVSEAAYFNDIYLDSITIKMADEVSEAAPELFTGDYIYQQVFQQDDLKELEIVLTATDFNENFTKSNLSSDLFFVYIHCKGTPGACTPCRLDEMTTVGVTFDDSLLYQRVMGYTKQFTKGCQIPVGFADFILLWNAFKASVETEHFIPAIKFWKMLFGYADDSPTRDGSHSPYGFSFSGSISGRGCGCHG